MIGQHAPALTPVKSGTTCAGAADPLGNPAWSRESPMEAWPRPAWSRGAAEQERREAQPGMREQRGGDGMGPEPTEQQPGARGPKMTRPPEWVQRPQGREDSRDSEGEGIGVWLGHLVQRWVVVDAEGDGSARQVLGARDVGSHLVAVGAPDGGDELVEEDDEGHGLLWSPARGKRDGDVGLVHGSGSLLGWVGSVAELAAGPGRALRWWARCWR